MKIDTWGIGLSFCEEQKNFSNFPNPFVPLIHLLSYTCKQK